MFVPGPRLANIILSKGKAASFGFMDSASTDAQRASFPPLNPFPIKSQQKLVSVLAERECKLQLSFDI